MRHRFLTLVFTAILILPAFICLADTPSSSVKSLPIVTLDTDWQPLRSHFDQQLQTALLKRLKRKGKVWTSLIDKNKLSVGVVDLSDAQHPRFAYVNGDEMMYAASLPKIAILLAAHHSIEQGKISETPELRSDMGNMIRFSDNAAATRLIDLLGFNNIEKILCDSTLKLYDPEYGGGLWVGKRYARLGGRNPDPMEGLSHAATVNQVCRFYYLLSYGRLISIERSANMLEDLSNPGIHHKFVGALDEIAPDATLYRKSGTWRNWHCDSVLVWEDFEGGRRYILVGMVEYSQGGMMLKDLVPAVEEVLFTN